MLNFIPPQPPIEAKMILDFLEILFFLLLFNLLCNNKIVYNNCHPIDNVILLVKKNFPNFNS